MTWEQIAPTAEVRPRRYREVRIAPEYLAAMIGQGTGRAEATEPVDDLEIVGFSFDLAVGAFRALCYSETFDELPEGALPAVWMPAHRSILPEEELGQQYGIPTERVRALLLAEKHPNLAPGFFENEDARVAP